MSAAEVRSGQTQKPSQGEGCKNPDFSCWGAKILDVWSSSEVNARRMQNHNRPDTRALPGFTCRRWTDGIQCAIDFLKNHCVSVRRTYHYGNLRSGGSSDLEFHLKTLENIANSAEQVVHIF